jgi:hypothetical protein
MDTRISGEFMGTLGRLENGVVAGVQPRKSKAENACWKVICQRVGRHHRSGSLRDGTESAGTGWCDPAMSLSRCAWPSTRFLLQKCADRSFFSARLRRPVFSAGHGWCSVAEPAFERVTSFAGFVYPYSFLGSLDRLKGKSARNETTDVLASRIHRASK